MGGTSSQRAYTTCYRSSLEQEQSKEAFFRELHMDASLHANMTYKLSFAERELESTMRLVDVNQVLTSQMRDQLAYSQDQLRLDFDRDIWDHEPLPRSFDEIVAPSPSPSSLAKNHRRAIVVTEIGPPFRIVHVNEAWEGLCGYTADECRGETLGSLLRGPDTDRSAITAMIAQLLKGEREAGVVITNYTKTGRRFRNRLRVGPLHDPHNEGKPGKNTVFDENLAMTTLRPTHFVGVLQEIHDGM